MTHPMIKKHESHILVYFDFDPSKEDTNLLSDHFVYFDSIDQIFDYLYRQELDSIHDYQDFIDLLSRVNLNQLQSTNAFSVMEYVVLTHENVMKLPNDEGYVYYQ